MFLSNKAFDLIKEDAQKNDIMNKKIQIENMEDLSEIIDTTKEQLKNGEKIYDVNVIQAFRYIMELTLFLEHSPECMDITENK